MNWKWCSKFSLGYSDIDQGKMRSDWKERCMQGRRKVNGSVQTIIFFYFIIFGGFSKSTGASTNQSKIKPCRFYELWFDVKKERREITINGVDTLSPTKSEAFLSFHCCSGVRKKYMPPFCSSSLLSSLLSSLFLIFVCFQSRRKQYLITKYFDSVTSF